MGGLVAESLAPAVEAWFQEPRAVHGLRVHRPPGRQAWLKLRSNACGLRAVALPIGCTPADLTELIDCSPEIRIVDFSNNDAVALLDQAPKTWVARLEVLAVHRQQQHEDVLASLLVSLDRCVSLRAFVDPNVLDGIGLTLGRYQHAELLIYLNKRGIRYFQRDVTSAWMFNL